MPALLEMREAQRRVDIDGESFQVSFRPVLPHEDVWNDAFQRIDDGRHAEVRGFGVGMLAVGLLGLLFVIAGWSMRPVGAANVAEMNRSQALLKPAALAVGFALLALLFIGLVVSPL